MQNETFSFGRAIELLKAGKRVARHGWNGKDMFVYYVEGSTFNVSRAPLNAHFPEGTEIKYRPHLDMRAADGTCGVWLASTTDILSEDWYVLEAVSA